MPGFKHHEDWPVRKTKEIDAYRRDIRNRVGKIIMNLSDYSRRDRFLIRIGNKIVLEKAIANRFLDMIGGGDHTNFICGNDADAKSRGKSLLNQFGWKDANIVDLGDISSARGTEAILPVWVRIWGATQNGAFNFKIVS
jgi:hypothetical protein